MSDVELPAVPEVDVDLRPFVRPGDTVVFGQAAGEPLALTRALVAHESLPVTHGQYRLHSSRIAASVRTARPLLQVPSATATVVEQRIAATVAELVPDGATVQFGIGRLPDAITAALAVRRRLVAHSGLLTDAFVDLVDAGAVDRSRTSVAAAAVGTDRLYRLLESSPWLELHPYTTTHAPAVLASLPGLVAINAALEVDLTGQVAAERVDDVHIGAVGGQGDFLRGAARSPGGLPIVVLTSVARNGTVSRIVDRISSGVVTTARADAGVVVTEHGVADLRGRTLRERAEALVAVADPAFRDELARAVPWHT